MIPTLEKDSGQLFVRLGEKRTRIGSRRFEAKCAASSLAIACLLYAEPLLSEQRARAKMDAHSGIVIFNDGTHHPLRITTSPFDYRITQGPPRWSADGRELWIKLGDAWERREFFSPPDEKGKTTTDKQAAVIARRLKRQFARDFSRVEELPVPAFATTEARDANQAFALRKELTEAGLSAVVFPGTFPFPTEYAHQLARKKALSLDAVWAQLERLRRYELGGAAAPSEEQEAALLSLRNNSEISQASVSGQRSRPSALVLPDGVQGPYGVLVIDALLEELPMILGFGGFNGCPPPAEHALILEDWRKRYGAELIYIGRDEYELLMKSPPATRLEAAELAWRIHLLNSDGNFDVEAETQAMNKKYFYFWWD